MNAPLLKHLVEFIEQLFKNTAPVVEKAAVATALQTAEADPKVQAVTVSAQALLAATKELKAALDAPTAKSETKK